MSDMPGLWIMIVLLIASSIAKEVNKPRPHRVTPCGCKYKGLLYDISQLARSNGTARFTIASAEKDNFYSYNPCIPFSIFSNVSRYHCTNVAMCYWSKDGQRRDPLAYQYPGQIHCELSDEKNISLVYLQGGQGRLLNYTTTIEMICDRSKKYPREATMKLKSGHKSALPIMKLGLLLVAWFSFSPLASLDFSSQRRGTVVMTNYYLLVEIMDMEPLTNRGDSLPKVLRVVMEEEVEELLEVVAEGAMVVVVVFLLAVIEKGTMELMLKEEKRMVLQSRFMILTPIPIVISVMTWTKSVLKTIYYLGITAAALHQANMMKGNLAL